MTQTDLKKTPTANFVVKYSPKDTDKKLNGFEACELSRAEYGPEKLWVLLERVRS